MALFITVIILTSLYKGWGQAEGQSHGLCAFPLAISPSVDPFRGFWQRWELPLESIQNYGFSGSHVCMWEWTIKKAECRRIDVFELWCWRRLLRVPWTARRSNQSILKEMSPGCSLEGLMLKLKLQYFGHLMWRADSFEKILMLEKIEGRRSNDRGWDGWMASLTQWTWVWVNSRSWWWTVLEAWHAVVRGVANSQTWLSDWTELKTLY